MSQTDHLKNLITTHTRQIQKLKEQQASFGAHTAPHILTEIEDREAEIERLQSALEALEQADQTRAQSGFNRSKINWGDAPDVSHFYGRTAELTTLKQWISQDRCHLVALLGMGGIGKTALVSKLSRELQAEFEYVIWHSLRNAPPIDQILTELIRFLSGQPEVILDKDVSKSVLHLLDYLQNSRCLLIIDNAETILQGEKSGYYLKGYEGYGELFRKVGETAHQSCLVLTSREKPPEVGLLEGKTTPVRSLAVKGLSPTEGQQILESKSLAGSPETQLDLIERYSGNPLALNLVAEMIHEVYIGQIDEFLADDEMIFGHIEDVISEQFARLSVLEQALMFWLAIEREPVSQDILRDNLIQPASKRSLMVALHSLRRRSLIETSELGFTLQNVVMEYMTGRLIEHTYGEICLFQQDHSEPSFQLFSPRHLQHSDQTVSHLGSYALIQATAKDYARETQIRLILTPLIERLLLVYGDAAGVENQLKMVLARLRQETLTISAPQSKANYAAGNILNLLCQMGVDLTGFDFSSLTIWQAYLRGVDLHEVNLAHADIAKCVFNETMSSVFSTTFSPDGKLLAMADFASEIHLWRIADRKKLFTLRGHVRPVWPVVFSPDRSLLVSGSDDETLKVWAVETGQCLKTLTGHSGYIRAAAFSPDGRTIASGSGDHTVKLWDVHTGECLNTLNGHKGSVLAVAFSPDGYTLSSGSSDNLVKLWDVKDGQHLADIPGHQAAVMALAFSPDGRTLSSGSSDHSVKLWDARTSDDIQCLATLQEHTNHVHTVAFSPDGHFLASGGQDMLIKLWDIQDVYNAYCLSSLRGHTSWIWAVEFNLEGNLLVSGSADQSVKLWDVKDITNGKCIATWQGRIDWVRSVTFNATGNLLASGSADKVIRLWDISSGDCLATFEGHTDQVHSVAFRADDQIVASGGWDGLVKLWDVNLGQCLATLANHESTPWSVAFNPEGTLLASGSHDTTVKLWEVPSGRCLRTLTGHQAAVYSVAFSADGQLLASGSFDCSVKIWDAETGQCLATLAGESSEMVACVAFSPDGKLLASGNRNDTIRLWDVATHQCLANLEGHTGWVYAVAFSPNGKVLASGAGDDTIRLWDIENFQCLATLEEHTGWVHSVAFSPDGAILASGSKDETIKLTDFKTGQTLKTLRAKKCYEGMNITGVTGISDAQKATLIALGAVTK